MKLYRGKAMNYNDYNAFKEITENPIILDFSKCEYSAKVEHPDRFELNSATAKIEQSNRRN